MNSSLVFAALVLDHHRIPIVGCKSHLLNSEVNFMVKEVQDIGRTLISVHETMTQCKQRLKNAALLRNLVSLSPFLYNHTRWSGKQCMLQRFLRIRDELIEVSDEDRSDLAINSSEASKDNARRYCKQLKQIDIKTKYLQTRKLSLSNSQNSLYFLIAEIQEGFNHSKSPFYHCFLKKRYICTDARIPDTRAFERDVCKIKDGKSAIMTEEEKMACECFFHSC